MESGLRTVDVRVSGGIAEFNAVYTRLCGAPGLRVTVPTATADGTQGGEIELITVAFTAAAGLFKLLTAIVESRGPAFKLTIRQGRNKVELTADNVEEVAPALKELLGGD